MLPCFLRDAVATVFQIYLLCMLVYAIVSWIPAWRGRWTEILARVIEPVLEPVRRVIPPMGGLDLSFLALFFVIQICVGLLRGQSCTY